MAFQLENLRGLGKGLNSAALRLGVRSLHGPTKINEYVETAVYPKISVSIYLQLKCLIHSLANFSISNQYLYALIRVYFLQHVRKYF